MKGKRPVWGGHSLPQGLCGAMRQRQRPAHREDLRELASPLPGRYPCLSPTEMEGILYYTR